MKGIEPRHCLAESIATDSIRPNLTKLNASSSSSTTTRRNTNPFKQNDNINNAILSPTSDPHGQNTSNNNETYMTREEQIRLEEERLKAFEERVQQELSLKRQELLQREKELREIEARLENEAKTSKRLSPKVLLPFLPSSFMYTKKHKTYIQ